MQNKERTEMKDEDILKIARETDSEQYYFSEGWVLAFARRILAAAIPEGMVLVPKEPTAEMLNTFANETPEPVFADRNAVHRVYGRAAIDKIYRAMIAAATEGTTLSNTDKPKPTQMHVKSCTNGSFFRNNSPPVSVSGMICNACKRIVSTD